MLLQSHMGYIEFLPALPSAWPTGMVKGIKARGAFVFDFSWKNGKLSKVAMLSLKGAPCKIYSKIPLKVTCQGKSVKTKRSGNIISFPTKSNGKYSITPTR